MVQFFKRLLQVHSRAKINQMSAAFAYGAIFAVGPLLLILVSVVGLIYGKQAAEGKLLAQLTDTLGSGAAQTVQTVLAHTYHSGTNIVILLFGVIGLLLAAAGITSQLKGAFNTILEVKPKGGGVKHVVYSKIKDVLLVLLMISLLSLSIIISTLVANLSDKLDSLMNLPPIIFDSLNNIAVLILITGLIYFIYRAIPDSNPTSRLQTLVSSAIVAVLFVIGKLILAFVIGHNATASAYGAAASFICLLLWFYYISQLLFIGMAGLKAYK